MAQNMKGQPNQPGQQPAEASRPERAPKMKAVESGVPEQGQSVEPKAPPPVTKQRADEIIRQKEREEYQHGGIPLGSDPRE